MANIEDIEGVGPALAERLSAAGIGSIEALLEKGGTKEGRGALAEQTGIAEAKILKFVNHADLMRINGIGPQYSELLEAAGVDSVPELAQRNAANLAAKLKEINEAKNLVNSNAGESTVQKWIDEAKSLPRAVHH